MPVKGGTALYRPVPKDFDEIFERVGWTSICEECTAGWVTVKKWIRVRNRQRAEEGLPPLRDVRAAHVKRTGPDKSPARQDYHLRTVRKRKRVAAVTRSVSED